MLFRSDDIPALAGTLLVSLSVSRLWRLELHGGSSTVPPPFSPDSRLLTAALDEARRGEAALHEQGGPLHPLDRPLGLGHGGRPVPTCGRPECREIPTAFAAAGIPGDACAPSVLTDASADELAQHVIKGDEAITTQFPICTSRLRDVAEPLVLPHCLQPLSDRAIGQRTSTPGLCICSITCRA